MENLNYEGIDTKLDSSNRSPVLQINLIFPVMPTNPNKTDGPDNNDTTSALPSYVTPLGQNSTINSPPQTIQVKEKMQRSPYFETVLNLGCICGFVPFKIGFEDGSHKIVPVHYIRKVRLKTNL